MGFEKVRAYIDSLEASYGVPGVDVIVMKDHEVVFRHQAGHRDHDKTVPVDGTELYDIYSRLYEAYGRENDLMKRLRSLNKQGVL